MSYVLTPRRADAVKPGDVVLAQHDGLVGAWRVTRVESQPSIESSHLDAITLLLHRDDEQMIQLHRAGSLVLLLTDAPEPEPEDEQVVTLRLKVELG